MSQNCAHCGESCSNSSIKIEDKSFCCDGCKTVYQMLSDNDLCNYYGNGETPGNTIRNEKYFDKFDILNDEDISRSFLRFEDKKVKKVLFKIPTIHCSSCIWLLENLNKLDNRIISSEVNFQKKEVLLSASADFSLKDIAILLSSIGYEPSINNSESAKQRTNFNLILKIGVAGFCFGNIMLFAFPEYLGLNDESFSKFFAWLSFALSIPVLFFAGSDYIKSAVDSVQQKFINMDIPIAIGMITIFVRSTYEIVTGVGSGYFDSLSGLVFFLLVGKWFQQKTYETLSFERTYKSYFPLSVKVENNGIKEQKKLEDLGIGEIVYVRNEEIIPADAILLSHQTAINYSFVTGESDLVDVVQHESLFAGGKNQGIEIKIQLTKKPSSSYLTQLWNKEEKDTENSVNSIADKVSKYFTLAVLLITLLTTVFWIFFDPSKIWSSVTAVLIVACPCALALTIPFTLGNSIRYLGRKGIYLKNTFVIEKLAKIDTVAFDKTGTITKLDKKNIEYVTTTTQLDQKLKNIIYSITSSSTHPLSKVINSYYSESQLVDIIDFSEIPGFGVSAYHADTKYFIGKIKEEFNENKNGNVGFYIGDQLAGYFIIQPIFRESVIELNDNLKSLNYSQHLISGDTEREEEIISKNLYFDHSNYRVSPNDKKKIIAKLQENSKKVVMIGDGLNDAGALSQANVGIAVSDDINYFVPACDVIMDGNSIKFLDKLLRFSKTNMNIIKYGFLLSFSYNIIGLTFAVSGTLSPIIAAILMPVSSISVVAFTSLSSKHWFHKLFDKN